MLEDACWVGDAKVLGTDHSAATVRGGMRDGTTFFAVQGRGRYTGWDTAVLGDELTFPRERCRMME
jgi:hypothetical protein